MSNKFWKIYMWCLVGLCIVLAATTIYESYWRNRQRKLENELLQTQIDNNRESGELLDELLDSENDKKVVSVKAEGNVTTEQKADTTKPGKKINQPGNKKDEVNQPGDKE